MSFLDLVKSRYSVRNYALRAVEQEKLDYVMECVRLSPSAVNFQPWKFAIVQEKEQLEALKTAYPREWIQSAPCMIVACADHEVSWHRKADGKDHADIDVAIAVEHLHLPANLEPLVLIPLGYPADETVPEKKRKALPEILL